MAKWQIPEPIPVGWPMRTLESARVTWGEAGNLPRFLPELRAQLGS